MNKFNNKVPHTYEKNGEEKTAWRQVGELIEFEAGNGKERGFKLSFNMFPNTKFMVFKNEDQDNYSQTQNQTDEDITPEDLSDIPF